MIVGYVSIRELNVQLLQLTNSMHSNGLMDANLRHLGERRVELAVPDLTLGTDRFSFVHSTRLNST